MAKQDHVPVTKLDGHFTILIADNGYFSEPPALLQVPYFVQVIHGNLMDLTLCFSSGRTKNRERTELSDLTAICPCPQRTKDYSSFVRTTEGGPI